MSDQVKTTAQERSRTVVLRLEKIDRVFNQGPDQLEILKSVDLEIHQGEIVALVGPSGAGKSTVANMVEKKLHAMGKHTYTLDGDNVRHGLNKDLGFTDADRVENIRRVGETAKLFVDAGVITLVSFISPFKLSLIHI